MMELKIWGVLLFAAPLALGFSRYYEFERQVCLETVIKFGFSGEECRVNKTVLESWFDEPQHDFLCKQQCQLSTWLWSTNIYILYEVINIQFHLDDTLKLKYFTKCSSSRRDMTIDVKCPSNIVKDYFGLLCTSNTDCWRPYDPCSTYGDTRVCTYDDGFVGVDGDCKTGQTENVKCIRDEECYLQDVNSCCNKTTCTCCPGYQQQNGHCEEVVTFTTEYQVSTTNPETQQLLQDSESGQGGSSAGTVAGVGLGGFVFGVVVSLSIVFIMRKRGSPRKQFSESRNTAVNFSYDTQTERIEAHQDRDASNTKQVSHVRPTIRDTPYSNVKRFSENDNGDIYNHLHEKENPGADLDDYEHTHPSNEHGVPDEDYSHLRSQPERGMESQQNDDVYDRATSIDDHDNYFTLEKKSDLS